MPKLTRPIIFGEVEGYEEGAFFSDRKSMMPSSFHRKWGGGIDWDKSDGVAAIVLSGGYEDDFDSGDEIVYTGAGGNENGKQIEDQSWENKGNSGLLKSMDRGLPIRVIRGYQHKSDFSPLQGYTYAGLYTVVDAWEEDGKSGFKICRFRLIYCGNNNKRQSVAAVNLKYREGQKGRTSSSVLRIVRDSDLANNIKLLYKFECQVCAQAIPTKKGFYAEGAHIKPLGRPHLGDDSADNLLCLCPNHHVMFDKGSFSISDDFGLLGSIQGVLRLEKDHLINHENLAYHRKIHGYD